MTDNEQEPTTATDGEAFTLPPTPTVAGFMTATGDLAVTTPESENEQETGDQRP